MSRLLKITYGSLVLGKDQSDTSYHLTGKYQERESYGQAEVSFEVVVSHNTRATFLTAEATLVTAYTKPDQALTVVLGSTTRHSFDPTAGASGNSGFLARPFVHKVGSVVDTANSALYRCGVVFQLPADLSGRSGRRDASVEINTSDSGRRTVTLSGTYTALTTNSASAQYTASVSTWASTVLPSGTFELVEPRLVRYDDQDKILTFRLTYREVLSNQAVGTLDHAAIVSPRLIVRRRRVSGEQARGVSATALVTLMAEFSCGVDKDTTTDLASFWSSTVQPRVLEAIRQLTGLSSLALIEERPDLDPHENRIGMALLCQADPGADIYESRVEEDDDHDLGVALYPVLTGSPFDRDRYDLPQSWVKTITRTTVGKPGVAESLPAPSRNGFVEVRLMRSYRYFPIGIPGTQLEMAAVRRRFVLVRANVLSTGTSAASEDDTSGRRGPGGYAVDTEGV